MIPAVPFAFISPHPLFRPPEQRASDADRDTAVDILSAAAADGRLTLAELEERAMAALSARTLSQLAALIADLIPTPRSESTVVDDRWTILRSLVASA